jgi:MoaA/NifB/PqqE/SkfB family radical SAM enzyme
MNPMEQEKYTRVLRQLKGGWAPPFKIDVELHRRCNSNCLSCSRRADTKFAEINEYSATVEMPKETWLGIVREAAQLGVKEWHVAGGGEPMFLPDVTVPVMNEIKKHRMYGIITTNGTLWDERMVENAVRIGWDQIHFSIDGPDPETCDRLRGLDGYFDKATRTIRMFNELKERHGAGVPHMDMNTVLSSKNYTKLPDMVELAHDLNIQYMFVEPLIVYSAAGRELKLNDSQVKDFQQYLKRSISLADKYRIDNNFSGMDKNLGEDLIRKSSRMDDVVKDDLGELLDKRVVEGDLLRKFLSIPCYKPWWHMSIKCDGRVTSCDVPVEGGDDIRGKSLADAWNGQYFKQLREKLLGASLPGFCAQCNPSHTTQSRRMRLDIIKMIEPNLAKGV